MTQLIEDPTHTLYVFVRTDMPIEHQMVQAAHAAAEAGRKFYQEHHGIARLIILAVPDKFSLHQAQYSLKDANIEYMTFFEPDNNLGDTAAASRPLQHHERKFLRKWPLWHSKHATTPSRV